MNSAVRRVRPLIALAVALVAGAWLLVTVRDRPAAVSTSASAAASAPAPVARSTPAKLPDGSDYTPLFYADATTSVGTAPNPTDDRLVLRSATGDRELRKLPHDRFAQFLGFTAAAGTLYWAESSVVANATYETRIWSAPLDGSAPPTSLTADTGAAVFFDSEYDLVVAGGRIHWVAAPPDDTSRTELRSVPVTGGPVTTTSFAGRYRHTTWPWLLSVDDQAPLTLANPETGEHRTVTRSAAESVVCTPTWCRSMIQAADRHLFDVRHPDGTARARVPGDLTAIGTDNAIAGHYDLFTELSGDSVRLVAYDLNTTATQILAPNVGVTAARAGLVWWADRPDSPTAWLSVDLR